MAKPKFKISTERLQKKMRQYERIVGQEMPMIVKRQARLLCVELGKQTQPFGNGSKAKEQGEGAVKTDVNSLFIALNDFWWDKSREDGAKFLFRKDGQAVMANAATVAASLSQMAEHHRKNRNRHSGRARKIRVDKQAFAEEAKLKSFIKQLQKSVGMAKAGWAKCAQLIGVTGNPLRGFPAWVKRHVSKADGRIVDRSKGRNPTVKITNKIGYVSKVLSSSQIAIANNMQRGKMMREMNKAIKYELTRKAGLA
jgi:hypothetical protein